MEILVVLERNDRLQEKMSFLVTQEVVPKRLGPCYTR